MAGIKSDEGPVPTSLVTGGSGFLGSHVCDRLIAEGHEVICLDNFLTGRPENVEHLIHHPRFTLVRHDVITPFDLRTVLDMSRGLADPDAQIQARLHYVLHLASPSSPKDYARYPIDTLRAGALGTYHALELARVHGCVFLLASTSEVYGEPEVHPQAETYRGNVSCTGPRGVYAEAKRFAEAITLAYQRQHRLEVRIARLFNVYGERMRSDDGRVLPNFITQALRGEPLTVYGDGTQTRSLCYVGDAVEGLYRLLGSNEAAPVNLGNPEEISIRELAEEVIEIAHSSSTTLFEPLPTDDPVRRRPDISKAVTVLGWKPGVSRREGIERVTSYFRGLLADRSGARE